MMSSYYSDRLSGERLKRCYEIAPPRVQRYLRAEVAFVLEKIGRGDVVLDLGCGYGRIIGALIRQARLVVGIDISGSSLSLARATHELDRRCLFLEMDASKLAFLDGTFDVVVCIQNGISAFHRDPLRVFQESVRVTKPLGSVLFSTYSEKFWSFRLDWFRRQAEEGLLGEIDEERTGQGVIVCRDGFHASTLTEGQLCDLAIQVPVSFEITEVDASSLFCVMKKKREKFSNYG